MLLPRVDKSYVRLRVVELQEGQKNPGPEINTSAGQPETLTFMRCGPESVGKPFSRMTVVAPVLL